jgi:hypothetical protein
VTLFLQPPRSQVSARVGNENRVAKVAILSFALSGALTGRRQALAQFMPDVIADWDFID